MNKLTWILICCLVAGATATVGCATTEKALIEKYVSVTPTRFEGAVAVVLEDRRVATVDDQGVGMVVEGFTRTKLLDRKATDCGQGSSNCRLQSAVGYNELWDEVELVEARTITPEGEVIPLKKEDYRDVGVTSPATPEMGYRVMGFELKGATEGAILEVRYRVRSKKILGHRAVFQGRDPVLESSYTIDAPADYAYKWKTTGQDIQPTEQKKGNRLMRTWTVKQLPAFQSERDMVAADDVLVGLKVVVEKLTAFAGYPECDSIKSWEDMGRCWQKHADERQQTPKVVQEVIDELKKVEGTETDKLKAVWKYMNDNVRYVYRGKGLEGFVPKPASMVCSKKYGDCKAVSNLTSVLCRGLGLKADPVMIGIRPVYGEMDKDLPGPIHFNHMITRAEADGKVYFLDATMRDASFDTILAPNQGVDVVVLRPGKAFVDRIPIQPAEHNLTESKLVFVPDADGNVALTSHSKFVGQTAAWLRSQANTLTAEKFEQRIQYMLADAYPQAAPSGLKVEGKEDNNGPFSLEMQASIPKAMQPAGKGVSFEVKSLRGGMLTSAFSVPKRRYALDLSYLSSTQARYEIQIPKGMVPAGMPRNVTFEDDWVKLERLAQVENDRVVAIYNFSYKQNLIPADKYAAARKSFHKALDAGSFVVIFEPEKKKK